MSTTVIANNGVFGQLTNQIISRLISQNTNIERLNDAVATAAAGYTGTAGTEYEIGYNPANPFIPSGTPAQMMFGVQASETPGEQGTAYAYAIGRLHEEWLKFWAAAEPFVSQLDNGVQAQ